jgi:site-specific DNA recombinase
MSKVALYARVSTDEQNVAQQAKFLQEWATKNEHQVVKVVQDEESARIPLSERKRFLKLLNDSLLGEFEAVLVFKLDRLTRNWGDVALVENHFAKNWNTCKLISVYDAINLATAQGKLTFRISMAINCYEVEAMFERQRVGIDRAKAEGKFKGGKRGRTWAV